MKWYVLSLGALAWLAAFGAMACEPVDVTADGTNLENGVYCLTADVGLSTGTIRLRDNATLDCQGHRIRDLSGNTSYGVLVRGDNIVLKNCLFDGFEIAVNFANATNYRIQDNVSVNARSTGIGANGSHGLIARNIIRAPASAYTWQAIGAGGIVDIIGNTVILGEYTPVAASVPRTGIATDNTHGDVIAYNLVKVRADVDETGAGISSRGPGAVIYRNVVVANPGAGRVGIECNGSAVVQNVILGLDPAYSSCTPYYETSVGLKTGARRH